MSVFLYFAYGSNMLTARLAARCPSARIIGRAKAEGHTVRFSKLGRDLSGKATLVEKAGASQEGVVFEILSSELPALDAAEGSGYARRDGFAVTLAGDSTPVSATTYIAREIVADLKPFDWYLALIVAGAKEHGLHADQITAFRSQDYHADTELHRPARLAALEALKRAGSGMIGEILEN